MGRKKIPMLGRIFGRLEVVAETAPAHNGEVRWLCKCKCGNTAVFTGSCLRTGHATSCGHCLKYAKSGNVITATDINGNSFVFDADDFELVSKYRWWVSPKGYVNADDENRKRISLHRLIMGSPENQVIDHINGDCTDCRKENLRIATVQQNSWNSKRPSNNTSGYKGVYYDPHRKKYEAYIRPNGHKVHLGRYDNPIEAAMAYDRAAAFYFGEYARTNYEIGGRRPNEEFQEILELA